MTKKQLRYRGLFLGFLLLGVFSIHGIIRSSLPRDHDPRDMERVLALKRQRQSDSFQQELRSSRMRSFFIPGLKAAQLSFGWLEALSGLHEPESVDGDFSWLFAKLHRLLVYGPQKEYRRVLGVAPFLLVIGNDEAGSTLVMNELTKKAPDFWTSWFWAGFHAMENLENHKLASSYFEKCASFPGAPPYTAALALRLRTSSQVLADSERRKILIDRLPAALREKIKKARPGYID